MSDGIIRKIKDDSKVVNHTDNGNGDEWFRHVREYNIFNDAQACLIADGLRDVQVYARTEHESGLNALVEVLCEWQEGIYQELDKLHHELRTHRERVAMLEGQLRAMMDLKGVPGKQGERGARGELGKQGARGDKGDAGAPGAAAPHWIGVKIEGFDLITVLSNGTLGPRISLKQMFEEFVVMMARK
jgi:hypothetical protein